MSKNDDYNSLDSWKNDFLKTPIAQNIKKAQEAAGEQTPSQQVSGFPSSKSIKRNNYTEEQIKRFLDHKLKKIRRVLFYITQGISDVESDFNQIQETYVGMTNSVSQSQDVDPYSQTGKSESPPPQRIVGKQIENIKTGVQNLLNALTTEARLVQKQNPKTKKKEWALVARESDRVLQWFGTKKPSDAKVQKREKQVQWFKHH